MEKENHIIIIIISSSSSSKEKRARRARRAISFVLSFFVLLVYICTTYTQNKHIYIYIYILSYVCIHRDMATQASQPGQTGQGSQHWLPLPLGSLTVPALAQDKGGPSKGGFLNSRLVSYTDLYLCNDINGMCIYITYYSGKIYFFQEATFTRTTFVLARLP